MSVRAAVLTAVAVVALALLPALPAAAASDCYADGSADVRNNAAGTVGDFPPADLQAFCADHTAAGLTLAARTALPTDPLATPAWEGNRTALGYELDADDDGDAEFGVNLSLLGGALTWRILDRDANDTQRCTGAGAFDGTRYRVDLPASCLESPRVVAIAAFLFYDSDTAAPTTTGYFDEVPAFPGFVEPLGTAADPPTGVERLAGPGRAETAIEVSEALYPVGGAAAAVLARADAFPDALAGTPLAVAVDGPLLLTSRTELLPQVQGELARVLPPGGTVHLLGGEAALTGAVADQLTGLGYVPERVAGATRYETAIAIARRTAAAPPAVYLADGNTFPSALVAGAAAGAQGAVVVLTDGAALAPVTASYLQEHGEVPQVAVGAAAVAAAPDAEAVAGADAFATSRLLAERTHPDPGGVAVASGTAFPDGLAGGVHAARNDLPLLLSWPDLLPGTVAGYLSTVRPLDRATLYGGTAALSSRIARDVATALD